MAVSGITSLEEVLEDGFASARRKRQRQLVASGAAAGVSAGLNAPLAGVFFALEVLPGALRAAASLPSADGDAATRQDTAELDLKSGEAISSALTSALVASLVLKGILGEELALRPGSYGLESSLAELPLYFGLGACAGGVAVLFDGATTAARQVFAKAAPSQGSTVDVRPVLGGLACGLLGLAFPQVLFVGYATLNTILEAGDAPSAAGNGDVMAVLLEGVMSEGVLSELPGLGLASLLVLLLAKLLATAICAGSGLVGGTFAPSLYLGAVLGTFYQAATGTVLTHASDAIAAYQASIGVPIGSWGVIPQLNAGASEVPAYALIGAAATLAAVFRAPMTATLLCFELSRSYSLVLPMLAAAGTGPRVVDWVKQRSVKPATPKAAPKIAPVDVVRPIDASKKPYVVLPGPCSIDNKVSTCMEDDGDE